MKILTKENVKMGTFVSLILGAIVWLAPKHTPEASQGSPVTPPASVQEAEMGVQAASVSQEPEQSTGPGPVDLEAQVAQEELVEAPLAATASRLPSVSPGEAGVPDNQIFDHTLKLPYGAGWGKELPLMADGYLLTALNPKSIVNTMYSGVGDKTTYLSNSLIYGPPVLVEGQKNNMFWGFILFDWSNMTLSHCTIQDIHIEHGQYITSRGGANCVWDGVLWDHVYAQAIQWVYSHPASKRYYQTAYTDNVEGLTNPPSGPDAAWLAYASAHQDEWLKVQRCETKQCTIFSLSERAGFTFSFFEPLSQKGPRYHKVLIEGNYSQTSWPYVDNNNQYSDCSGWLMSHNQKHIEVRNNTVIYRDPDKPDLVQIWGVSDGIAGTPDVVIEDNLIASSGMIEIRLGNANDTVVIRNNRATPSCRVRVSSEKQPWYAWETSPNWIKAAVIAEFPLNGATWSYGAVRRSAGTSR